MSDDSAGPGDAGPATRPLNPFASRYVRPGAIPYVFDDDRDVASLVDAFEDAGRRGAIVGPHGSGKSTLLAGLEAEFVRRGREVRTITLRDGGAGMPPISALRLEPTTVLVIDGYEQLGWWRRRRVRRAVRRAGAGLLVTAHAPVDVPTLYATWAPPDVAVRLVRRLLAEHAPGAGPPIDEAEIARRLAAHGGDVRELFFGLYDLYESHRS